MAMVDMVDSYRALPKKLRLFYRQLAETYNYDFVLKIDDDTYVNIERVLGHLKNDGIPLEQTWYGHMRCDWNRNEVRIILSLPYSLIDRLRLILTLISYLILGWKVG